MLIIFQNLRFVFANTRKAKQNKTEKSITEMKPEATVSLLLFNYLVFPVVSSIPRRLLEVRNRKRDRTPNTGRSENRGRCAIETIDHNHVSDAKL